MAEADDWRLTGQERYLAGAVLQWVDWQPPRPGWDHDHCEFCWAKFGGAELPDALHAGYTTPDRYRWVCPRCFADFRARFGWRVLDALAWEVLNATADDWESVDQLHAAVVRFLAPVGREAVAGEVERLVAAGLFEQRPADAPPAEAWFRMTAAGRAAWHQVAGSYARQAEPGAAPDPAG